MIKTFPIVNWEPTLNEATQQDLTIGLEQGHVIYLPKLTFMLNPEETIILTNHGLAPRKKNISFNPQLKKLSGTIHEANLYQLLKTLMQRYANTTQQLVKNLLPTYHQHIQLGRTSYRPIGIIGRQSSPKKDDTRLHVDAFPSMPLQGRRILRVFSNINPHNEPRIWRIGEPFEQVAQNFLKNLRRPLPYFSQLMCWLGLTKQKRSVYDHYMLQIHNAMKLDNAYQKRVQPLTFEFGAGSSWIVFTDQVSHAAVSGQYCFEQTFYLPVAALYDKNYSPLAVLERLSGQRLIA